MKKEKVGYGQGSRKVPPAGGEAAGEPSISTEDKPPPSLQPIPAQGFYGSAFQLTIAGNDFTLLVSRIVPAIDPSAPSPTEWSLQVPSCMVHFSPESLKDLSLILSQAVKNYEAVNGAISTDFTKKLGAGS